MKTSGVPLEFDPIGEEAMDLLREFFNKSEFVKVSAKGAFRERWDSTDGKYKFVRVDTIDAPIRG